MWSTVLTTCGAGLVIGGLLQLAGAAQSRRVALAPTVVAAADVALGYWVVVWTAFLRHPGIASAPVSAGLLLRFVWAALHPRYGANRSRFPSREQWRNEPLAASIATARQLLPLAAAITADQIDASADRLRAQRASR
jgi:hypothetical protein